VGTMTRTPRTLRGAIVAVDRSGPPSRIVVFQYNPDEVSRTLQPREGGGSANETHRAWGAPTETVSLTVEVDATDQLEAGDPLAAASGVLPALSVLEMLLHPSSAQIIANTVLLAAGTVEILPPKPPLAVLVWGPARVVPVKLTNLQITEEAYSPALIPIRASVEVSADVLTYEDLPLADLGFGLSVAHLVGKEVLAVAGATSGAGAAVAGLVG
jgi:hypothetical protein